MESAEIQTQPARRVTESIAEGVRSGWLSFKVVAKVMIPVYIGVDLLAQTEAIPFISRQLEPIMGLLGLPGEAALVLVGGLVINLYAAVGAAAPLGLTPKEISILGLILGIAHSLPIEMSIIRQLTPRWVSLTFIRLGLGLFAGSIISLVME